MHQGTLLLPEQGGATQLELAVGAVSNFPLEVCSRTQQRRLAVLTDLCIHRFVTRYVIESTFAIELDPSGLRNYFHEFGYIFGCTRHEKGPA